MPAVAASLDPSQSNDATAPLGADEDASTDSLQNLVSDWEEAPLDSEARCLAAAIFFESRSESLEGQLAVANVVLARAHSGAFPSSICGVLMQRGQFGFVRRGRIPAIPTSRPAWRTAQAIAQIAMDGSWRSEAANALYFHSAASPFPGHEEVAQIGNHVFYR